MNTDTDKPPSLDPGWIEGLPTEAGDYWFYVLEAGYQSRVAQGETRFSGNDVLMHISGGCFLYPRDFKTPLRRVWHRTLQVPLPPDFDRTCPRCQGTGGKSYLKCHPCRGKGVI